MMPNGSTCSASHRRPGLICGPAAPVWPAAAAAECVVAPFAASAAGASAPSAASVLRWLSVALSADGPAPDFAEAAGAPAAAGCRAFAGVAGIGWPLQNLGYLGELAVDAEEDPSHGSEWAVEERYSRDVQQMRSLDAEQVPSRLAQDDRALLPLWPVPSRRR